MADMPLYEGDAVTLYWGTTHWNCRIFRSAERCARCEGPTVRLDPPWDTWSLFCLKESALTTTPSQRDAAFAALPKGAVGIVSSLPVRIGKPEVLPQ